MKLSQMFSKEMTEAVPPTGGLVSADTLHLSVIRIPDCKERKFCAEACVSAEEPPRDPQHPKFERHVAY